jgi:polysaccharide pyruvyl transferase WcaK-like protein
LSAALSGLRRPAPEAELLAVCVDPADTGERHGIPAIPLRHQAGAEGPATGPAPLRLLRRVATELAAWRKALAACSRFDALVVAGTGVLTDTGEGTFGLPYEMFKWAVAARLRGRRLLFVSVGAEDIARPLARFFIGTALRLAHYRTYRDLRSRERLQRCGFPVAADPVLPDLAFSLARPEAIAPMAGSGIGRTVAVGLYNYQERGAGGDGPARSYRAYLDSVCSLVAWLLERGFRVRIILGDYAYDEAVRQDLREVLAGLGMLPNGEDLRDEPARSWEQVLDQLASVDMVVASRFHNVLLALFLGKPVVSVSYDFKNDALMHAMGMERYCQTLDRLDLQRLLLQVGELDAEAGELGRQISDRSAEFRRLLEQQYLAILEVVAGSTRRSGGTPA